MEVHNCEQCSYKTKLLFGMIYHVRRHRSNSQADLFSCEKPQELYSCPHCYFESDLSIVLKEHAIALHKKEETEEVKNYNFSTYDCVTCKFQTFSVLVMLKHVTDSCKETTKPYTFQRKRFECDQCSYVSNRKSNLNCHMLHKHTNPEDVKWLECDGCELKFKTSSQLRRHRRLKHEIEWFECAHCQFKTTYKSYLRGHMYRKHGDPSDIKWFECDRCSFRSKNKSCLKRHVNLVHFGHEKKVTFACGQCSYVANRIDNLRSHTINKHTSGERIKRHRCDQCPYGTNNKADLKKHKIYKHVRPEDIKWLECDKCDKKFKIPSSLRFHVKYKH